MSEETRITPEMLKNASIKVGKREIPLYYDLRAQIEFEEELGMTWDELRGSINRLKGNKNTKTVIQTIRIMGNRGLKRAGQEPDLTDDWLLDHILPKNLLEYRVAILETMMAGRYMETEENADEQGEVDIGLMEIRKKKESTD